MGQKKKVQFDTLPLFPLPVVLFPESLLPLHIFEERYKLMISETVDKGSHFGVVLWDGEAAAVAETGCSAEVIKTEELDEGKMNIMTVGKRRFRIRAMLQERPYLLASVEYVDDKECSDEAGEMAEKIRSAIGDILRLSSKIVDKEFVVDGQIPDDPAQLSFWVASNFYGSPIDQQELLEMLNPIDRLEEELMVLDAARKHLAAKASLKDALG